MLEFHIVALLALLPMCLGTVQVALLLAERHDLDFAAFHAARRAAMSGADMAVARAGYATATMGLFMEAAQPVDSANLLSRSVAAQAAAMLDQARYARFTLLAPDQGAQADFAIRRRGERVIPNDGLEYRSTVPGRRSGVSLQQANVLRIQVSYCRPLVVPFARELLLASLRAWDTDPWRRSCYAAGRVPIVSLGTTPMQSDFRVTS